MSVIQKIRDKYAAVIIALIAISLIAFILMDAFSGRGGGSLFGNTSAVGKVNGTKIEKREFDRQIELFKTYYNMGNSPYEQLIGQAWEMNVDKIVMNDEYEKAGIVVSDKELNSILFGPNPPQWMRQQFADQQTGQYNPDQAAEQFRQMKKMKGDERSQIFWDLFVDGQTIQQTLRSKYLSLLTNSTYVPKWLAEKQMTDNASLASISYVYVPYSSVSDSTIKVTDDEINSYVKTHASQYKAEDESRVISYVTFNAAPSAKDSDAVRTQLLGYENEFKTTTDEKAFIERVGSEMPYANTYFSGSRIQQAIKDTLLKTSVGSTFGPYTDGNNYVLAKMVGVKNWPDSAKVRHILIKTQDPRTGKVSRDDSSAKKLADSLETAIKNGANFDSLVVKFSEDEGSNTLEKKGVYDYFPQGQMVETFNDFAFDKPVGSKGVVKTEYGYHYMEVLGQKNFQPAYKIAYLAKPIVPSQATIDAAQTEAQKFASASKTQKAFNENVTKFNKTSLQSPPVAKSAFSIGGLGESRELIRWMYESDMGDVSQAYDLKDKFIVAMLINEQKKGLMNAFTAKPSVESLVRNEKKARKIIAEKFKGNTLEAYAQSSGMTIARADSLMFISSFIPNIGMESKVAGAAFNRNMLNKVTEPIAGTSGVFGVRVELIGARPTSGTAEDIRKNLESQLKSGGGYNAIGALRKAANIKDYRFTFF
jgi:peptidyl-prolyl cis-trans isomerase D